MGIDTGLKCEECGKPLYHDMTNRGKVTRCRNPQCTVNEVVGVWEEPPLEVKAMTYG